MNILFMTHSPMAVMGGYETLIMRMSDYLIRRGHSVFLICEGVDARLRSEFNSELVIQTSGTPFVDLYSRSSFKQFYRELELPTIDLIVCIDMLSYVIAGLLKGKATCSTARLVLGLFQPDSVRQIQRKSATALLVRQILKKEAPHTAVIAMTKRLQAEWNAEFGSGVSAEFIPLPVDLGPFRSVKRQPEKYKIVSVGRLNDYKTYNIFMIEIVRRLVDQGLDVTYEIYGEGPFQPQIEAEINKYELEGRVTLKGHLSYEKFPDALRAAYGFVGMGTAAIEAAATGVPTVYSAPRDMAGVTHGLLHEFDLTKLGGFAHETNPPLKIYDVLADLIKSEPASYDAECQKSREAMAIYSMEHVMAQYKALFEKPKIGRSSSAFSLWLLCDLIQLVRCGRSWVQKFKPKCNG